MSDTQALPVAAAAVPHDRPLHGLPHPYDRLHPGMYLAEFVGTALLVAVGLSIVIAMWGEGGPLGLLVPEVGLRRAVTGFLFGGVGAAVAFSQLGRISGAHINPAMTFAFWLEGKIAWRDALGYVVAQISGAVLGALPLLLWGRVGASDAYGATVPAAAVPVWLPVAGEAVSTFLLVTLIFIMAAHKATQPFTPLVNPPLFSLLVWLESPLSGTSANPARSFGPAVIGDLWHGQWVYVLGPLLGAALAVAFLRLELIGWHRPHEARLFHFHSHAHPSA